jgi:DNA-binding transcriptional LysR family regulator
MNDFARLFDVSGLSLERLLSFLQVVEAGGQAKAAKGDPTRQSQFSRQIRELEGFFGIALTRRVGRRIEITDDGLRLAGMIRRQFREIEDFREAMAGRSVSVRIGSQGSVIDWLLLPRLDAIQAALGNVMVEMEQLRTADVVRAVADGRLDFGVVREDAVATETKRWPLGKVGYALFAVNAFWKGRDSVAAILRQAPVGELLPGGQFTARWRAWLDKQNLHPRIVARVSSFTDLVRAVQAGHAAAVLPDVAVVDFDPQKFKHQPIEALKARKLVLIANARNLERMGGRQDLETRLSAALRIVFCR